MDKMRVLFVCVHNSARSQMAEAFLNRLGGERFSAESAGLEPGIINPYVVEVMKEAGVDLSGKKTSSVFDFLKENRRYDYVVTVCDETSGALCPVFPGNAVRLHWNFKDPAEFKGSDAEVRAQVRILRDKIKEKVQSFIQDAGMLRFPE